MAGVMLYRYFSAALFSPVLNKVLRTAQWCHDSAGGQALGLNKTSIESWE